MSGSRSRSGTLAAAFFVLTCALGLLAAGPSAAAAGARVPDLTQGFRLPEGFTVWLPARWSQIAREDVLAAGRRSTGPMPEGTEETIFYSFASDDPGLGRWRRNFMVLFVDTGGERPGPDEVEAFLRGYAQRAQESLTGKGTGDRAQVLPWRDAGGTGMSWFRVYLEERGRMDLFQFGAWVPTRPGGLLCVTTVPSGAGEEEALFRQIVLGIELDPDLVYHRFLDVSRLPGGAMRPVDWVGLGVLLVAILFGVDYLRRRRYRAHLRAVLKDEPFPGWGAEGEPDAGGRPAPTAGRVASDDLRVIAPSDQDGPVPEAEAAAPGEGASRRDGPTSEALVARRKRDRRRPWR